MTKQEVQQVMDALKKGNYPLFVSERHFVNEFICEAKKQKQNAAFIPEYPIKTIYSKQYIDLLVIEQDGSKTAIEFKYVLQGVVINLPYIPNFPLRNRSSGTGRKHAIFKDIKRIEELKANKSVNNGFVVLLTNMPRMYNGGKKSATTGNTFEVKDGSKLQPDVYFGQKYAPITLDGTYPINYDDYAGIGKSKQFKSLIIEI